jgi:exonuclease SbcD
MRLLHTSDWHLGRTFHGHSLLADQESVLDRLVELAVGHRVDAVLISGDIYDRAVPAPEAVQCATRIFAKIREAGITIVAISGNHDSPPRLGAFTEFLAAGGLYLRTAAVQAGHPVLLTDAYGPVAIYPVPYLEPDLVRAIWDLPAPASHQNVLGTALELARANLARQPPGTRSIVLAHAFVVGATLGGSERTIAVGGVESVSADVFDGFDYVALGHLHSAQVISDRVRYSGSPLPYAFSEAGRQKACWIIDLDKAGGLAAALVELPIVRHLATVRGELNEILCSGTDLVDAYLSVELTDAIRPLEPMRRLREKFPHTLVTQWIPQTAGNGAAPGRPTGSAARDDLVLLVDFVRDVRGSGPGPGERALLREAATAERLVERVR